MGTNLLIISIPIVAFSLTFLVIIWAKKSLDKHREEEMNLFMERVSKGFDKVFSKYEKEGE